ncbi:MAG: hypothetical protein ACPHVX_05545, partial [Flavobacteriaceae bacterium]
LRRIVPKSVPNHEKPTHTIYIFNKLKDPFKNQRKKNSNPKSKGYNRTIDYCYLEMGTRLRYLKILLKNLIYPFTTSSW